MTNRLQSTRSPLAAALRRHVVSPHGKFTFVETCAPNGRLLDVGCGNDSPRLAKALRSDIYYVGLDVGDHHHSVDPNQVADEYIVVPPEAFGGAIAGLPPTFDAVISAHNLEHCNDPDAVLTSMARVLAPGGRMYLSFPSEASVNFPKRDGCLNFYDDPTHNIVPQFDRVCQTIRDAGLKIEFAARQYRPLVKRIQGLLMEPKSRAQKKVMPGTWALYGFETVIWAVRPK